MSNVVAVRVGFIYVIGRLRENIVGTRRENLPRANFCVFSPLPFAFFLFLIGNGSETDVDKVITAGIKCADK